MTAYYNEIDPYAADWLENLIKMGEIAPGIVDRRSIEDVRPDELVSYTQCHFFAGIGVWSRALRLAGWPDNRPVWTGSCPCQPFSAAGKGAGIADERHLWPAWDWLIEHGKPPQVPVLGEQVASSDGLAWLDIVSSDLEGKGYACWPYDLCAAGFGSPNIRQRLFLVGIPADGGSLGNSIEPRLEGHSGNGDKGHQPGRVGAQSDRPVATAGATGGVDNAISNRWGAGRDRNNAGNVGNKSDAERADSWLANATGERLLSGAHSGIYSGEEGDGPRHAESKRPCTDGRLADPEHKRLERSVHRSGEESGPEEKRAPSDRAVGTLEYIGRSGPVNGSWADADWIFCRDGKWRPVESGTFPLVDGVAFKLGSGSAYEGKSRAGMLKGYGNAINAEVAAGFITKVMAELGI